MRDAPSLDVADEMGNHETKVPTNDDSPKGVHLCINASTSKTNHW